VVIVGIGADGLAGLAPTSRAELDQATVIYGSQQQLNLLDDTINAERYEWTNSLSETLRAIRDDATGDVHIVVSGDPMLHGIGGASIRIFGSDRVAVLPHVSSVTLACARLGWSVENTEIIGLTRGPRMTVRRGGQAIVLSNDGSSAAAIAELLVESGRADSEFSVLEQLGGPAERCRTTTAREWAANPPADVDPLNVVAIRYLPDDRQFQVLPDDAYAHDGRITEQSIRAVTLAALAPRPGELLWDVGAGSGSIAIEWCRSGPGCRAIAFERDEVRRQRIADNAVRHGFHLEVRGEAPKAFRDATLSVGGVDGVQRPAAIFVGGGAANHLLLTRCYQNLPSGGRLIANAATTQAEAILAQRHSRLGGELRRFQHYRAERQGESVGWRPAMPITQWMVTKS
jgi:precorrin-6Y C5,15-methyltransferase (decarboxylating)